MISKRNGKLAILLAILSTSALILTACGKNPANSKEAWTAKEQKNISNKWLPARSAECQLFINMFQNFNTVISERMASTNNTQAAQAIKDFQAFTTEANLALTEELKVTKSSNIKTYVTRFQKFITGLTDTKGFTQQKASDLLTEAKWLVYNPPEDCVNP